MENFESASQAQGPGTNAEPSAENAWRCSSCDGYLRKTARGFWSCADCGLTLCYHASQPTRRRAPPVRGTWQYVPASLFESFSAGLDGVGAGPSSPNPGPCAAQASCRQPPAEETPAYTLPTSLCKPLSITFYLFGVVLYEHVIMPLCASADINDGRVVTSGFASYKRRVLERIPFQIAAFTRSNRASLFSQCLSSMK